jgi:NADH-quinone oxidoreductase subunit L
MLDYIWLIPALPLAGFLVLLVFGRRLGEPLAGWLATATVAGSFVVTTAVLFTMLDKREETRTATDVLFTWMSVGGLKIQVALLADELSVLMAMFITGVGALIHLYSIAYMHGDEKYSKFFLYLNLFVFSMLMLVLGDNLLVTFFGWEGVGVCSYLLISFWHTRNSAAVAGKKAFLTNRIGDIGFMLAMFLVFQAVGTLNYRVLNEAAPSLATSTAAAIGLLLFLGACGKSAQIPLYVWLPDAMEGPTPVSALIHAATMVTAGVYLMVRVAPVLHEVPDVGTVIAIVGVTTAFFAATVGMAQNDIKKVLAYSTVSQLGYMFLGIGTGGYVAAIFLMITHAFFKALLFLGAGSVIHGMNGEQDMRYMGRLRKFMPITAATFIVGWLAIAGVPPLAGFWAKDDVLLYAWNKNVVLWAVGLVTAIITAYYMTRQVIMVFYGESHWEDAKDRHLADVADADDAHGHDDHEAHGSPHESPWLMLGPLVVLALLSAFGGAIDLPFKNRHDLEHWLDPLLGGVDVPLTGASESYRWVLTGFAVLAGLVGIFLGWLVYQRKKVKAVEPQVLVHAWYVDEAYAAAVDGPGRGVFQALADGDAGLVDGAVSGVAGGVHRAGDGLRRFQNGFVRSYALGIGLGAVALLAWFVSRSLL